MHLGETRSDHVTRRSSSAAGNNEALGLINPRQTQILLVCMADMLVSAVKISQWIRSATPLAPGLKPAIRRSGLALFFDTELPTRTKALVVAFLRSL